MPSNPPTPNPRPHEIPCAQEQRILSIEEAVLEQTKCAIRIEEKLKTDFRCIEKLSDNLNQILVGNSTPGLPARMLVLEEKQETMEKTAKEAQRNIWTILVLILGSIITAALTLLWPKES